MTVEIDGANNIVKTNTISEVTSANGVTVDGLSIKDSKLVTANSVITANITDANVTTAKITDANVTQGKIADQAINEAKMQISNAPVNGYMLTAQSGNTGGLTWAEAGGGKILQVLVKALPSNYSMNSGTTTDVTNFSQAITMASSSNKLYIVYNLNIRMQGAGASSSPSSNFYITDASNNVKANTYIHLAGLPANNKERTENSSGAVLITPGTTSSYTVKARVNNASEGGTVQIFGNNYTSSITLMEIAV